MKKLFKYIALGVVAAGMATVNTSCVGDLDVTPDDPQTKLELSSTEEWNQYFISLYTGFMYGGNISTSDMGAGCWTRCHWNLQEITADEAVITANWNDPGYTVLNYNTWLDNNEWIYACFAREMDIAKQCGEFIQKAQDKASNYLDEKTILEYINEAHVLRAFAYLNMVDLFGRGPWIDENSVTGATPPTFDRQQLFDAATSELIAAINSGYLRKAAQQVYGRVSWEAANAVLAKFYLNAEVYTGKSMWNECINACNQVISTGIQLCPDYKFLFCGTNDKYVGNGEILWGVPQQTGVMETYAGTTYLSVAAYQDVPASELLKLGYTRSPWAGVRMRPELVRAFDEGDQRALYYGGVMSDGSQMVPDLEDMSGSGIGGFMCTKYTFTNEDDYYNTAGANLSPSDFCPADYPLIRLADVYLMLAESYVRTNQAPKAAEYLNKVRTRAGLKENNVPNLQDILKERQCELYWEGWRRSDLIRFGQYTGSTYLWSWKGGIYAGVSIPEYRKLFAIPYQYVTTIGQNAGY